MGGTYGKGPWRIPPVEFSQQGYKMLLDRVASIKMTGLQKPPCILLVGPSACGKSSFVNTVFSIGCDYVKYMAHAGTSVGLYTLQFRRYTVAEGPLKNCRLCDIPGLMETEYGFNLDDIKNIVTGHVAPGYKFETTPISEDNECYVRNPLEEDKMFCVIIMIDAPSLQKELPRKYKDKLLRLKQVCNELDIPEVVILTKIDKVCVEVEKDIEQVFYNDKVKAVVQEASRVIESPATYIYPVKNYTDEMKPELEKDIVILTAIERILLFISDKIAGYDY